MNDYTVILVLEDEATDQTLYGWEDLAQPKEANTQGPFELFWYPNNQEHDTMVGIPMKRR